MKNILIITYCIIILSSILFARELPSKAEIEAKKIEYIQYSIKNGIENKVNASILFNEEVNVLKFKDFSKIGIDLNKTANEINSMNKSLFSMVLMSDAVVVGKILNQKLSKKNSACYGTIYEVQLVDVLYNPAKYLDEPSSNSIFLLRKSGPYSYVSTESKEGYKIGQSYQFILSRRAVLRAINSINSGASGWRGLSLPSDYENGDYFYPLSGIELEIYSDTNIRYKTPSIPFSFKYFKNKTLLLNQINDRVDFYTRNYKTEGPKND